MAISLLFQDWQNFSKFCQKGLSVIAIWFCFSNMGLISGTGTANAKCLLIFQKWMSCHCALGINSSCQLFQAARYPARTPLFTLYSAAGRFLSLTLQPFSVQHLTGKLCLFVYFISVLFLSNYIRRQHFWFSSLCFDS